MKQLHLLMCSFFMLLCLNLCKVGEADLASEKSSLLVLRQAVGGRTLQWNKSSATPCEWTGVNCENGRVVTLRFPGMGLLGKLPFGIWGNFTELRTLSLRFNALSGSIPSDFAGLVKIKNLYLQDNSFSGEIPDFLFGMQSLVKLNLANNNFTGKISPKFNNLTRLTTLYLENNKLTGSIPDMSAPPLKQLNVSFNRVNGSIPSRFSELDASSFEGTSLCGKPLRPCNGTDTNVWENKKKLSGGAIAGIVIGSVIGLQLMIAIFIFVSRRTSKRNTASDKAGDVVIPAQPSSRAVGGGEDTSAEYSSTERAEGKSRGNDGLVFFTNVGKAFDLEDLLRASAEVLGKGTFGTTYKATLEIGTVVAVKRLKKITASEKEFREKMKDVGKIVHENLVSLKGYHFGKEEKLLVYDYLPMGSLSAHLHGCNGTDRTPMNWGVRCKIAYGAARGIAYLHSQRSLVSHGNIKSSNILLTRSYEARVSDFCLSHLALPSSSLAGFSSYRAPEVTDTQKVSQKADVYSFGVILLELLTGRPPTHSLLTEEGVDLPRYVQSLVREERNTEVFDMDLRRRDFKDVEEEMIHLLQLALECTRQHPDTRPSMDLVVSRMEDLYHSSLHKNSDKNDSFQDADDGTSQRYYSADSMAAPSSSE